MLAAGSSGGTPCPLCLPYAMHVTGAVDAVRRDHLPAMDHAALSHREATVMTGAHGAELTVDAHLLTFQAGTPAWSELASPDTVADASLLVELAFDDLVLCRRGCGLCECKSGRCCECRY